MFERSSEDLAGRGAGIGTREDLFAVLRRIGAVIDPSAGVRVKSRICLGRDGSIVHERVMPAVNSAWDRIYRPLKDALPPECYRAGMRFVALSQDADGVTVNFADATQERGDLLVGADGIYSAVRQALMPEVEPRYAGYVAWRGVLEESDLPPAIHAALFEHFTFCLPDGELMLCLPMPGRDADTSHGRRRFHRVWYRPVDYDVALPTLCTDASGRRHGVTIPPPLIRAEVIAELKAQAQAVLAPQIAALVARTAQPLLQPIFDLAAPRIATGRVALIGDAAFVARPHVGAGVTKAALDALALTETLGAGTSVAASLAEYDARRRPLGVALVAHARRLGAYLEGRQAQAAGHDPETVLRDYGAAAMPAGTLRVGF